jgi:uracil-DNA glycosylase
MDALERYRRAIREREGEWVPYFSEKDGWTDAEVLFLFQDPGNSGAMKSEEVDRDNLDDSARRFKRANEDVGLPRERTVSWNAVPWDANGKADAELRRVREGGWLLTLLNALPKVRVVVLMGRVAHKLTGDLYMGTERPLVILHGPHTSNRGQHARNGFSREDHYRWLCRVIARARDLIDGDLIE